MNLASRISKLETIHKQKRRQINGYPSIVYRHYRRLPDGEAGEYLFGMTLDNYIDLNGPMTSVWLNAQDMPIPGYFFPTELLREGVMDAYHCVTTDFEDESPEFRHRIVRFLEMNSRLARDNKHYGPCVDENGDPIPDSAAVPLP